MTCLTRSYTDVVADALSGRRPKDVAARVDVSHRVAENWIAGDNGPSGAHLVRLMSEFDEVFQAIIEMTGRISPASLTPAQQDSLRAALAILSGE